jgi:signal transduction histidine kinase
MKDSDLNSKPPAGCVACGTLVISIKDQGAGLSSDELGHLFGEGVQFNPNKLQAGQGR